ACAGGGTVPVSRGAACTFNEVPVPGCPLTDGSLELVTLPTWFGPQAMPDPKAPSAAQDRIVLVLQRPVIPRLLVLRDVVSSAYGAGIQGTVEGSDDGVTWFPLLDHDLVDYPAAESGAGPFYGSGVHLRQP